MKNLFLVIAGLMLFTFSFSQDNYENDQPNNKTTVYNNEFGAHAGWTTGLGLSYRRWVGKTGVQLTALPIKVDDFTFTSLGVTALYTINQTRYIRSFLYLGGHTLIRQEGGTNVQAPVDETKYNFGFGPGWAFGKTVTFNLMVGYGFYDVTGEFNMLPTGEMGLYFKF